MGTWGGTFTDSSLAQPGAPDVHTVEWDPATRLEARPRTEWLPPQARS